MRIPNPLIACLFLSTFCLSYAHSIERCGFVPSRQLLGFALSLASKAEYDSTYNFKTRDVTTKVIEIHFHILQPPLKHRTYPIPPRTNSSQVDKQLEVVQNAFSKYGFEFKKGSEYGWHDWKPNVRSGSAPSEALQEDALRQAWEDARQKYHKGDHATLNVWVVPVIKGVVKNLGLTSIAGERRGDGVSVVHGSLPGGATKGLNAGLTLVHEIGHWLGLLHPFFRGCMASHAPLGVPLQKEIPEDWDACYDGIDTCPNDPGPDPVHNYMNYYNDHCLTEFTSAQVAVMEDFWKHRVEHRNDDTLPLKHMHSGYMVGGQK